MTRAAAVSRTCGGGRRMHMRPKKRNYKNERYDLLRRLNCCTICKTQDERTLNGGALCEKCCMEKRRKRTERKEQTKLCL